MGPGEGVGDWGAEGRAGPGGVWEALAVAARGRGIPNLHRAAPTGQSRLAAQGRSEEGELAAG